MQILTKITDLLFRKQKLLEIIAIFLFFLLVAFRFDNKHLALLWKDDPSVAVAIALITALLVLIWVRIERQKTQQIIDELKNKVSATSGSKDLLLTELTPRQQEIFDLIVSGKSNKEMTAELHIEMSTLKTHINHIYKALGISSRKETRKFVKKNHMED